MNVVAGRRGAWPVRVWCPLGVTRHSHRVRAEAAEGWSSSRSPTERVSLCPQETSLSAAEHWKNHTSLGKSCHPQRAISHPPSRPTHTPALCFVFLFFSIFHFIIIFKNNIDRITLVYNNTNQCKTFTLCRSLVQVYL